MGKTRIKLDMYSIKSSNKVDWATLSEFPEQKVQTFGVLKNKIIKGYKIFLTKLICHQHDNNSLRNKHW